MGGEGALNLSYSGCSHVGLLLISGEKKRLALDVFDAHATHASLVITALVQIVGSSHHCNFAAFRYQFLTNRMRNGTKKLLGVNFFFHSHLYGQ